MTFAFDRARPRAPRRASLTPMIDVVFLMLVFFMLAARFGAEGALPLRLAAPQAGALWQGPPRLIEVSPEGLALNGVALPEAGLVAALVALMPAPGAQVLVRPVAGASVQRLVDVLGSLTDQGIARIAVVE